MTSAQRLSWNNVRLMISPTSLQTNAFVDLPSEPQNYQAVREHERARGDQAADDGDQERTAHVRRHAAHALHSGRPCGP